MKYTYENIYYVKGCSKMSIYFNKLLNFFKKHLSLILIILFSITIVPILVVSIFNWAAGDDFRFSIQTHQAMTASGFPVFNVIKAAAGIAAGSYFQWQGTYSAIFLMALQPAIFSPRAYIAVTFILMGALLFSTVYLLNTILSKCFHLERKYIIYIAVPMLFLQIQFVPALVEAFYWYNGAIYYTFFYSIMLLYISQLMQIYFNKDKKYKKAFILSIALAIVLGGGNFVTGILTTLIGLCFVAFSLINHSTQAKRTILLGLTEAILLISFAVSIVAPGNSVRQQLSTKSSLLNTIGNSIGQAVRDIKNWTTPTVIIICLLLVPIIVKIVKQTDLQFRWPGIWIGFTFLLFAAQNAPPFYAQSFAGRGRLRNIVFYSFIWFVFISLFYGIGWLQRTYSSAFSKLYNSITGKFTSKEIRSTKNAVLSILVVLLVAVNLRTATLNKISSVICSSDLISGKAAAYSKQLSDRQSIIDNPNIDVVRIPALTVYPESIAADEITYDENSWRNKSMAIFYNKKSIVKYNKPVVKQATPKKATPQEPVMLN